MSLATPALESEVVRKYGYISDKVSYQLHPVMREDARSELLLNIILKSRKYDPNRGVSMRNYLWQESVYHVKYITQMLSPVKTPIRDHSLRRKILNTYHRMLSTGSPSLKAIATQLKTPLKTVERVINAHLLKGDTRKRGMILENYLDSVDTPESLEVRESFESLYRLLKRLNSFDRLCICLYYGIDGEKLSKPQISTALDVPKYEVDKAIKRALKFMRSHKDQIVPL